jgi:Flp pilus assembly pilin Flp
MQTRRISAPLLREGGERGQTMVEYSIVAALIAVVAMVAVQALGVGVTSVFNDIVSAITTI